MNNTEIFGQMTANETKPGRKFQLISFWQSNWPIMDSKMLKDFTVNILN